MELPKTDIAALRIGEYWKWIVSEEFGYLARNSVGTRAIA
jgi:hypothetical protein